MRLDGTTNPRKATELKIGFLSAVDMPAHEGAQALVLKARIAKQEAAIDMTTEQLMKSVFTEALMETKVEQNLCDLLWQKVWPVNDALKEAAEKVVKDETITDKPAAMRQIISEYVAEVSRVLNETDVFKSEPTQQEASMADEKQLAKLRALAEMTDVQKAHHCKLDEQGQADFEAMSAAERDAVVKALQVTDETFTDLDGNTVAKSKVGDAAYSVMKSQHDRLVKMQDEIDTSRLTKQAESELAHLPGDLVAKAQVLKAVEAMPQGTRDALMQMLKAGDAASAPGFKPAAAAGDGETSDGTAMGKIMQKSRAIADEKGITMAKAQEQFLSTPEGQELYAAHQKGE